MKKEKTLFTNYFTELFEVNKKLFFVVLVILFLIIRMLINEIIIESIPNYQELLNDGSLMIFQIFNTLNYIWTPFALLWKFTVTAFLIWSMSFLFGYRVGFSQLWQLAMLSEMVFLLPEIVKFIHLTFSNANLTAIDIQNYYPLSILSFFNTENIPKKFHYPLKSFNLFEIVYVLHLIFGFQYLSKRNLKNAFWVIVFGYVLFFLLWLLFFSLSYR
jgi:hypothetical protein